MLKAKKNKIVLGTILGVALVSLASVGFAQWQVGVQQKEDDKLFNVEIDTATQNTAVVEVTPAADQKLRIAEIVAVNDPNKNVTTVETTGGNFVITLTNYRIIVDNKHQVKSVTYSVFVGDDEATGVDRFKALKDNTSDTIHPSYVEKSKSYIAFKTTNITSNADFVTKFNEDTTKTFENHKVYKAIDMKFEFDWGDYFENTSPAAFYEEKMSKASGIDAKIEMSNGIIDEINGMNSITDGLTNKVVHIKVSIETEAKA